MSYWPSLFGQVGWILTSFFFCVFMDRGTIFLRDSAGNAKFRFILLAHGAIHKVIFIFIIECLRGITLI